MHESANVRSIEALGDLRTALVRFAAEVQDILDGTSEEIRCAMEWLDERYHHWHAEASRWQNELDDAKTSLASCEEDDDNDCANEQEAVYVARKRLDEALEGLETVRMEQRNIQEAVAEYQRESRRLTNILAEEIPKATALLNAKIDILQSYLRISVVATEAGTTTASRSQAFRTTSTPSIKVGAGKREIRDIPLGQINLSDSHIKGTKDFQKVSHADMAGGLWKLEQIVKPALQKGADGDYFSALDTKEGLDYEQGYRRIYDAFYGQDAVVLEKVGDTYQVTNGYHRLFIAKELGIKTIPALILGTKPEE